MNSKRCCCCSTKARAWLVSFRRETRTGAGRRATNRNEGGKRERWRIAPKRTSWLDYRLIGLYEPGQQEPGLPFEWWIKSFMTSVLFLLLLFRPASCAVGKTATSLKPKSKRRARTNKTQSIKRFWSSACQSLCVGQSLLCLLWRRELKASGGMHTHTHGCNLGKAIDFRSRKSSSSSVESWSALCAITPELLLFSECWCPSCLGFIYCSLLGRGVQFRWEKNTPPSGVSLVITTGLKRRDRLQGSVRWHGPASLPFHLLVYIYFLSLSSARALLFFWLGISHRAAPFTNWISRPVGNVPDSPANKMCAVYY